MIKQMAWNTFKNTGDINTFLELVQLENIEKNNTEKMDLDNNTKVNEYGKLEDKRDNIIRE